MTYDDALKRDTPIHPVYLVGFAGLMAGLSGLAVTLVTRRWRTAPPPAEGDMAAPPVVTPAVETPVPLPAVAEARRLTAALCALGALGLMIFAAIRFQFPLTLPPTVSWEETETLTQIARAQAGAAAIAGGLLLGAAVWVGRRRLTLPALTGWTASAMAGNRRLWLLPLTLLPALVMLGLLFLGNARPVNAIGGRSMSQHVQMALLIGGIAVAGLALSGTFRPRLPTLARREALAVLALTLLGVALYSYRLEDAVHIFVDEFHFAEAVARLWTEPKMPMLSQFGWIASFPWTYPYLQQGTSALFGPSLTGLRAVSVVFGALTIPALWLLARTLFDRKTALLAALLLAVLPPHLHFSRLGLNNIADPLFGTLALAFLARGIAHNRRVDWALGGLCLGLTQYWYEGGRLLYPPLALAWLVGLALIQRRRFGRSATPRARFPWRGLLVAALGFALLTAPLYLAWSAQGVTSTPRLDDKRIKLADFAGRPPMDFVNQQVVPPILHFVATPDASGNFYGGQTPLLLVYLAPLFLFGFFYALWRLNTPGGLLLVLWIGATVAGNALIYQNNWAARFVVAFPAMALLCAVALVWGIRLVMPDPRSDDRRRRVERTRTAVVALIAALLAILQVVYYFGPHLEFYNRQLRPIKDHIDVAYRAREFPPDTRIYIVTDDLVWEDHYRVLGMFWGFTTPIRVIKPEIVTDYFLITLPQDVDIAFFAEPEDLHTYQQISKVYPIDNPRFSPYNVPITAQYALYYVEALEPAE